jgi:prevent-host-death family protein
MEKNTVSASELKTHCSKILDGVARKRDVVEITKHGKIVARIVPVDDEKPKSLFGFARGCVSIYGDILESVETYWEAAEP